MVRGIPYGRAAKPVTGISTRPLSLLPLLTLLLASASAADEPVAGWKEIAILLTGGGAGESAGPARFVGAPDATGALPFADLRNADAYLTARHPLLSAGYESGTGAVSEPIALAQYGVGLALELGHVEQSSLTLAANPNQLGAQIEDRSFTQLVATLGDPSNSQLSLVLGRSEELRRQTAGFAYEDPYGFSLHSLYGASNRAGETDTTGLALDWSLFSGKAVLKAGYARSVFSAPESPLAMLGFNDPLAQLAAPPEEGDARYLDLSLTPWSDEDGLIRFKLTHSDREEEFSGDAGWNFAYGGTEQSISADGRWRALSFSAERREKEDRFYDTFSNRLSANANLNFDWLDLSLSRSRYESTSEYPYLTYVYGYDPDDYYAGMWVPVKISNTRASDIATGAASLHGEAWSVDLGWSRTDGSYFYGWGPESMQRS
ncbi:MAG: hypothetical protein K0S81_4103, partial [Rhodospirillales bacterium]|nr:hypothetical protein [Rhodospirillales bacterium]